MKRIFAIILCLLLLSGCSQRPNFPTIPSTTDPEVLPTTPAQPGYEVLRAVITPLVSENHVAQDGTLLSFRRYPKIQLHLDSDSIQSAISMDLQSRLEVFLDNTAGLQEMAQQDYTPDTPWYPYFATVSYTPTRIDQQVLSFQITNRSQTNELHPTYTSSAVTYSMSTGQALILDDILVADWSGQALSDKICDALSEIAENLDPDYEEIIRQRFSKGAGGSTAWYFTENGLCFYFDPYDIAPFFMGVVTAKIPYKSLGALLRPEFVPLTQESSGQWIVEPWLADTGERFFPVLTMAAGSTGDTVALHPTGTMTQVKVEVCPDSPASDAPAYTLFTADFVHKDQALQITADFSDPAQTLKISWQDGHATLSFDRENDCYRLVYG